MPGKKNKEKNKFGRSRAALVIFAVAFLLTTTLGVFALKPKPAQALFGIGDISITAGDIPRTISNIVDRIKTVVQDGLKELAIVSLNNAVDRYVQNVAYETAVRVATGGVGQDSLIVKQPLGKILQNAGESIAGDFLDSLATDILGHSLCEPIDPRFNLQLTVYLEQSQKPAQAKCTLTDIWHKGVLGSYENIQNSGLGFSNLQLEDVVKFSSYFDPRSNNLGTFMVADQELKKRIQQARELEQQTRQIEGNFSSVRSAISGDVKTPAESVKSSLETAESLAAQKSVPAKETSGLNIMGILARGLTTFSRTFLGEWTKTLFEKGLSNPTKIGPSDALFVQSNTGLSSARNYYKELVSPNFDTDIPIDVTSQLANCPADQKAQRWYNCRINNNLKTAIDRQVTLKEALTPAAEGGLGILNPDAIFGYDRRSRQEPSFTSGFPYSSLVIMRKYRIVPATWELAALYIKDVMRPDDHNGDIVWTIERVMNCYEEKSDLNSANGDETLDNTLPAECRIDPDDPNSVNPFYHLVDPNWVLKAPATKCVQEGPGPEIVYEEYIEVPRQDIFSDGTDFETVEQRIVSRADYCAEELNCIKEDDSGNCEFYGLCVKEEPIWRFDADTCPAQFDTCRTISPVEKPYSSFSNYDISQESSFLSSTLKSCALDSAGCGWFSLNFDFASGEWEGNIDLPDSQGALNGEADRLYANSSLQTCSEQDAGCTLLLQPTGIDTGVLGNDPQESVDNLIAATAGGVSSDYNNLANLRSVYMKTSPDWMDCSKSNPNKPKECERYATECELSDLGCQFYAPVSGDPAIPAIHSQADICTADCQGFNQYTEVPSWFTDAEDGVIDGLPVPFPAPSFVPSTAQACQQPGCEAFTNLDAVSAGGEEVEYYTKIRQCVTPGADGTKTYFTWEGSDTTGFQLKRWVMLADSGGAPCTSVEPGSPTTCVQTSVCDLSDGSNCRSFFDNDGNSYNTDINLVIYSHEDCHPLRRNEDGTVYYGIPSLSQSCQVQNVGCLEYKGPAANNIRLLFIDTFEPEDTTVDNLLFDWQAGLITNESLQVNGHSLQYNGNIRKNISDKVKKGHWYTLTFFAKGGSVAASLTDGDSAEDILATSTALTNEWQYYQLGPVEITHDISDAETLLISGNGFIDNIIFKESPGTNLFIKDSWDQALAGQCALEGAWGCEIYLDKNGSELALTGFASICEEKYVGCTAFIDTQNSESVGEVLYNTQNDDLSEDPDRYLDNITVPADQSILLVDNSEYYCSSKAKGCELVGLPSFDRQSEEALIFANDCPGGVCSQPVVKSFSGVSVINNPDNYQAILCTAGELFCTQYKVGDSVASFIDPGNRICEYNEVTAAWYIKGTSTPCPTVTGSQPLAATSSFYDGWAGSCRAEYDTCSKIVDVEDANKSYYLLHNTLTDSINECQQQGVVDRDAGCRLFADYSSFGNNPDLRSQFAYDPDISPDGQPPQSNTLVNSSGLYPHNRTNVLIKVNPDRVCEQFLHCASSLVVEKKNNTGTQGDSTLICLGIGLCSELNSDGKCVDGSADLLGYNDSPSEFSIENTASPLTSSQQQKITDASWTVGLARAGAEWPQTGFSGLFSYHEMKEIGSPMTLPNSGFEDVNNFNHRYSTWPDSVYPNPPGPKLLQNSRIVTREGGVSPYEGDKMLSMTILNTSNSEENPAYITSAALPVSPNLDMSLSFKANFNTLIYPDNPVGICEAGHISKLGDLCNPDNNGSDCTEGPAVCEITSGSGWCDDLPPYESCTSDNQCASNISCAVFTCEEGPHQNQACNPNEGVDENSYCESAGGTFSYACVNSGALNPGPPALGTCQGSAQAQCDINNDCSGSNQCQFINNNIGLCSPLDSDGFAACVGDADCDNFDTTYSPECKEFRCQQISTGNFELGVYCRPQANSEDGYLVNPDSGEVYATTCTDFYGSSSDPYACSEYGDFDFTPLSSQIVSGICVDGAQNKIGNDCVVNSDCAATYGDCRPALPAIQVRFLLPNGEPIQVGGEDYVKLVSIDEDRSDWQDVSLQFNLPAASLAGQDSFRIQIIAQDSLSTGQVKGNLYIDNVEVISGLWTSASRVVGPSCRLYARSEALSCDDTDNSNVTGGVIQTHKGWKGYCVESVPDKQSVCLNWWPVDVVQGDVNLFSQNEVDDIKINGKLPASDIYYCVHSTGDLANNISVPVGLCVDDADPATTINTPSCSSYIDKNECDFTTGCAWDETLDECRVTNTLTCSDFTNEGNCSNTGACVWQPDSVGVKQPYYFRASEGYSEPARTAGDTILDAGGVKISLTPAYYSFGFSTKNRTVWKELDLAGEPESQLHYSMIQTAVFNKINNDKSEAFPDWMVLDRSLELNSDNYKTYDVHDSFRLNAGEKAWYLSCSGSLVPRGSNGDYCGGMTEGREDTAAIAIIFDNNGYLTRYWWLGKDTTDIYSPVLWQGGFYLRDICLTMVEANDVYGSRVPWVARFNNGSEQLVFGFGQDQSPYGSVAVPSNFYSPDDNSNTENPWLKDPVFAMSSSETLYCGDSLYPQSCARTGTPYSCVGYCGDSIGKVCIAGDYQKLGKKCVSNNDCSNPDSGFSQGVCGGVSGSVLSNEVSSGPFSFDLGVKNLANLFAKSQSIYGWDFDSGQYVLCDREASDSPASCYYPQTVGLPDYSDVENISWPGLIGPQSVSAGIVDEYDITGCGWPGFEYNNSSVCEGFRATDWGHAPVVNNFKIEDQSSGNISLRSGEFVTLTFYPNLDANRTPLKGMKIDWGDGTPFQPNQNLLNLAGEGLPIQKYVFVHQYICEGSATCVYYPRVQLRDNWNWCTLDLTRAGVYLPLSHQQGVYDCNDNEGWVYFQGSVRTDPADTSPGVIKNLQGI